MQTKLTLRLESALIEGAKIYAETTGKSLSQIVSDYFQALQNQDSSIKKSSELPPITQALQGILKVDSQSKSKSKIDKNNYQQYLEKKYL